MENSAIIKSGFGEGQKIIYMLWCIIRKKWSSMSPNFVSITAVGVVSSAMTIIDANKSKKLILKRDIFFIVKILIDTIYSI
tara:strand:- start:301 stop:543 length:243 start_codon:yes stop_codon:yes gene_type:complete